MRWISFFCVPFFLNAAIHHVDNLLLFQNALEKTDERSLVLFDVDYTLIRPKEKNFKASIRKQYGVAWEELNEETKSDCLLNRVVVPVSSKMPSLVKDLQARGVPTLAITMLKNGSFGRMECLETWGVEELKKCAFSFGQTFPKWGTIYFQELRRGDVLPLYMKGILFCASCPKEKVLFSFLERVGFVPERVVYIDDVLEHVEGVARVAEEKGILFEGFYYREGHLPDNQ